MEVATKTTGSETRTIPGTIFDVHIAWARSSFGGGSAFFSVLRRDEARGGWYADRRGARATEDPREAHSHAYGSVSSSGYAFLSAPTHGAGPQHWDVQLRCRLDLVDLTAAMLAAYDLAMEFIGETK